MKNNFKVAILFFLFHFLIFLPVQAIRTDASNPNFSGRYFENKADSLYLYGYDSVPYYYQKASNYYLQKYDDAGVILCKIKKGNYFINIIQVDSAQHILHDLENEMVILDNRNEELLCQFELLKGSLFYITGQTKKAIEIFKKYKNKLLSFSSGIKYKWSVLLDLGMCYEQKGVKDSAIYYYNKILINMRINNASDSLVAFDMYSRMIRCFVSENQLEKASDLIDFCNTVIKKFSLNFSYKYIYYYYGEAYYLYGRSSYKEALNHISTDEKLLHKYGGSDNYMIGLVYYLKARIFHWMGQFDRALNYYNLAAFSIENYKQLKIYKSEFLRSLGTCYYYRLDYKNALKYYLKSLQIQKTKNIYESGIYNSIASCYFAQGEINKAERNFDIAEQLQLKAKSPDSLFAYIYL